MCVVWRSYVLSVFRNNHVFLFWTEWQSLSGWSVFPHYSLPHRLPLQTAKGEELGALGNVVYRQLSLQCSFAEHLEMYPKFGLHLRVRRAGASWGPVGCRQSIISKLGNGTVVLCFLYIMQPKLHVTTEHVTHCNIQQPQLRTPHCWRGSEGKTYGYTQIIFFTIIIIIILIIVFLDGHVQKVSGFCVCVCVCNMQNKSGEAIVSCVLFCSSFSLPHLCPGLAITEF